VAEYKGSERRKYLPARRQRNDRRGMNYFIGRQYSMGPVGGVSFGPLDIRPGGSDLDSPDNFGEQPIAAVKTDDTGSDRRVKRPGGRRKDDLIKALHKAGNDVVLDISKTPKSQFTKVGKGLGKLAKKAGKLGIAVSAASSLYDMVNRNKE
jgi:hypothetical protein